MATPEDLPLDLLKEAKPIKLNAEKLFVVPLLPPTSGDEEES